MTTHRKPAALPLGLLLGLALLAPLAQASPQAGGASAPEGSTDAALDRSPARTLSLSEALNLARKNNRDLQAARERLRTSDADVLRAYSAILPRLTVQGRFTVNEPAVSLSAAQLSGGTAGALGNLLNSATLADVAAKTGFTGGPSLQAIFDYCRNTPLSDPTRAGADAVCQKLGSPDLIPPTTAQGVADRLVKSQQGSEIIIVPRTQLDGTIALSLPLIAPPAWYAIKGAKAGRVAQRRNLDATEAQLLQSVASAFYLAAGSDELVAARQNAINVSRTTLNNARARLEAGVVNRVEVTRAELALIQAQQRLREAEDTRGSSYRVLDTLVLVREPFKVAPPPPAAVETRNDGDLVMDALRTRPEVPALEAQIQVAETTSLSQALRWAPTLAGFGNMRLTNATGFAGQVASFAAGLQLDWTLFDGFERDAARKTADAQAAEARLRLRQLRDTIADDVQTARRASQTRQEGLKVSQRSVQLATETLELVRLQYEAGTATQLDLLTAQDQLVNAQVALAQARFDLSLSDITLRRLTGAFPGTDVQ